MSRRQVFILVLIAVILTGLSFALSRRDSRDWRSNQTRRLLPFPLQDITGVTVARPGKEALVFRRDPGAEWQIQLPDDKWDALDSRAADTLAALATLTNRDPQPDRLPPEPEKAMTLVASSQLGQEVRLDFGDIQNNHRAVIVDGDNSVVYGVNQDLLSFLDRSAEDMRNMYLTGVSGGYSPERISLSPVPDDASFTVTLAHQPGGWRLTEPVEWPVDMARVDLLLRWLDRLAAESVAADTVDRADQFGLKTPSGRIETWYAMPGQGGSMKRRIDFGRDAGSAGVYAKVESREPVFVIPKHSLSEIFMDTAREHPGLWRNFYRKRSIDLLEGKKTVSFRIERLLPTPAVLTITGDGIIGDWQGELTDGNGVSTFPVDPPYPGRPGLPLGILEKRLTNVGIQAFLADTATEPEAERWTAFPAWRISCRYSDGTASPVLTIYAADEHGDLPCGNPYVDGDAQPRETSPLPGYPTHTGFAFSHTGGSAILEGYAREVADLCLPLLRYRSRRVLRFDADDFARVHVETGRGTAVYYRKPDDVNEQWWKNPASPEPLMDDNNRFVAMLGELSRLETEGYVADPDADMSDFGLDQPEITAIVYSSSDDIAKGGVAESPLFTLSLGSPASREGFRYARMNTDGSVFLLPETVASALIASYQ